MDRLHLPGSWSSTANALEELAFSAKDALLTIDDFVPTPADATMLHAKANRVLRAQGNGFGRRRMRSDGTLRPERPPRGLIFSTGEDVPQGQSLRARQFIVEIRPGRIEPAALAECQHDAAAGTYALCMAGVIAWIAEDYEERIAAVAQSVETFRAEMQQPGIHRRTPVTLAELARGFTNFLHFAIATGAIDKPSAFRYWTRAKEALLVASAEQSAEYIAEEPAFRFITLLRQAITSGAAHVAGHDGLVPEDPETYGWRKDILHGKRTWQPHGERIGYLDNDSCDLFLIPDVAYSIARRLGNTGAEGLSLTRITLWKRLNDAGLLLATSIGTHRHALTVRHTLENRRQDVLHLSAHRFLEGDLEPSNT